MVELREAIRVSLKAEQRLQHQYSTQEKLLKKFQARVRHLLTAPWEDVQEARTEYMARVTAASRTNSESPVEGAREGPQSSTVMKCTGPVTASEESFPHGEIMESQSEKVRTI